MSAVLLFVVLIQLRRHYRSHQLHGQAANVKHEDECMQNHVEALESLISGRLIPLGLHTNAEWLPNWAGTGNDDLFLDVTKGVLALQTQAGFVPLPWPRLIPIVVHIGEALSTVGSALTYMDANSAAVRQFTRLPGPHCTLLEQTWYAHKTHHNAVVQDVRVYTNGPEPVAVDLALVEGENAVTLSSAIIAKIGPSRQAIVMSTASNTTLSTSLSGQTRLQVVTYVDFFDEPTGNNSEGALARKIEQIALELKHVAESHEDLLMTHEHAWAEARRFSALSVTGMGALDQLVPLAHHYFTTALGLAAPAATPDPKCGCYNAAPRRTLAAWRLPAGAAAMPTFVGMVQSSLTTGCCYLGPHQAMPAVVQELAQSVAGIELHGPLLRIAPSWDLPPGGEIRVTGIQFGHHRLSVTLRNSDVMVAREDRLSRALLAIGFDGKLFKLGLKPVSLPAETVYIGSDAQQ